MLFSSFFVAEGHQSHGIRLGSNQVSVTADNGAVVGILSTISPNPGETFVYQLLEEAERPFGISGDKVVVVGRKGPGFNVPRSDERVVSLTIKSIGNRNSIFTQTFYITIVGK